MNKSILILLLCHLVLSCFSQDLGYEVLGVYTRPILKEKLNDAKTISDINPGYPAAWISGYHSVEVTGTSNGASIKAVGINDVLTDDQKNILRTVDMSTNISFDVKYYSDGKPNDIKDIKRINFSYTLIPDVQAEYPGGDEEMKQYLRESAIIKISGANAQQIEQAVVKFTVNEEGVTADAHISQTSKNVQVDQLLIEAISNMPKWKPAENANGIKIKQEFELRVGNFVGC